MKCNVANFKLGQKILTNQGAGQIDGSRSKKMYRGKIVDVDTRGCQTSYLVELRSGVTIVSKEPWMQAI